MRVVAIVDLTSADRGNVSVATRLFAAARWTENTQVQAYKMSIRLPRRRLWNSGTRTIRLVWREAVRPARQPLLELGAPAVIGDQQLVVAHLDHRGRVPLLHRVERVARRRNDEGGAPLFGIAWSGAIIVASIRGKRELNYEMRVSWAERQHHIYPGDVR